MSLLRPKSRYGSFKKKIKVWQAPYLTKTPLPTLFLFPLLQLSKTKRRRREFPAAIPPAPSLSDGWLGAGDGGGPRNRCADVHRLASYLSRPRLCSPSVLVGGARVCRRGDNPRRLAFPGGVGEAERRRRRRRRITSPGLFLAPVTFYSGVNGEVAKSCAGVGAGRRGSGRSFLHECRGGCGYRGWKVSGSSSRSPRRRTAADGELRSRVREAWGASPTDGFAAMASSTAALVKAFV